MKNEVMSFYQLADELMVDEKGLKHVQNAKKLPEWEKERKKYRDLKSKYFRELFGERYKNKKNEYEIPIEDKELVKSAILGYTKMQYYKKLKKNQIPSMESIEEYVEYMHQAVDRTNISEEQKEKLKEEFYVVHQISSNKAASRAVENVSNTLEEKLKGIKARKIQKYTKDGIREEFRLRELSEEDIRYLIHYYEKLITNTTQQWEEIVELASEIRAEEILNISDRQWNGEKIEYVLERMSAIELIEQAIERYKEENEI